MPPISLQFIFLNSNMSPNIGLVSPLKPLMLHRWCPAECQDVNIPLLYFLSYHDTNSPRRCTLSVPPSNLNLLSFVPQCLTVNAHQDVGYSFLGHRANFLGAFQFLVMHNDLPSTYFSCRADFIIRLAVFISRLEAAFTLSSKNSFRVCTLLVASHVSFVSTLSIHVN
jgi:hypothetical protein